MGRPLREDADEDARARRRYESATILRWLELQSLALTERSAAYLAAVISREPHWNDAWARSADDDIGPRGGTVQRITATQGLEYLPLAEIVQAARDRSTDNIRELRDFRPFDGLVLSFTLKAISSLRLEMREGRYPAHLWQSLLTNWPDTLDGRLAVLAAKTLVKLPDETFFELRYAIPNWLQKVFRTLVGRDKRLALRIFDEVTDRYRNASPDFLKSGIAYTTAAGTAEERSEVSISKAINSPGGRLTEVLWALVKARKGRPFPKYLRERFFHLFELPGDGGGHAAAIIAQHLSWIEYWDPAWASQLLPFFELSHPLAEAVWHGIRYDQHLLTPSSQLAIKGAYLRTLRGEAPWTLDDEAREELFHRLVWLTRYTTPQGEPVISHGEARDVLTRCSDKDRAAALSALARSMPVDQNWETLVKPFLTNAWPRQLRFRSEATSREFARIAEESGNNFPEAVALVIPFVRPVRHLDLFGYRLRNPREDGADHARRFPESTVDLLNALVGDDPATMPWELNEILELLVESQPTLRQNDGWRRLKGLV